MTRSQKQRGEKMNVIQWPVVVIAILCFVAGWVAHELQERRRHKYRIGDHVYDPVFKAGATIIALGEPGTYVLMYDYEDIKDRDLTHIGKVQENDIHLDNE